MIDRFVSDNIKHEIKNAFNSDMADVMGRGLGQKSQSMGLRLQKKLS